MLQECTFFLFWTCLLQEFLPVPKLGGTKRCQEPKPNNAESDLFFIIIIEKQAFEEMPRTASEGVICGPRSWDHMDLEHITDFTQVVQS
jgi:hypothetical protein